MEARDEIRATLADFVAGRRRFEAMTRTLAARGADDSGAVIEAVRDLVNTGRMPADLGRLVTLTAIGRAYDAPAPEPTPGADAAGTGGAGGDRLDAALADALAEDGSGQPARVPAKAAQPGAALPDPFDPPTEPTHKRSLGADAAHRGRWIAPANPSRMGADPDPALDPAADGDAKARSEEAALEALTGGFRGYRAGQARARRGEDAVDAALSGYRAARTRRDARLAEAGRARPVRLAAEEAETALGVGGVLKDRFVLDAELGRGGMGVVYKAIDRRRIEAQHDKPYVAVKLLSGDFRRHPAALRSLEAEARKAQDLAHPNIVTVYDFDRDGSTLFMVMALLEGRPLDRVLKEAGRDGALPLPVDSIVAGLCAGLGHAHAQGIVHADIKPGNVFLLETGEIKLVDFGIASAVRAGSAGGQALSAYTRAYASPELLAGAPRDPRDDVYALGCVVYLLHGRRHPFAGEPVKPGEVPARPAGLPGAAWEAVRRALSFERTERPSDASAFHALYARKGWLRRLFG